MVEQDRRNIIKAMAAGAVGIGLSALPVSAIAQAASGARAVRRKMVIRADDVGMSKVCNIGAFETMTDGVVTSADTMLDCPGTEDALERLKALPWISVGWHGHMWGTPVLPAREVPSLVEKGGEFDGRFRMDLAQASDVVVDEAVRELRAQLARCIKILGRVPDTSGGGSATPWGRAVAQVVDEFGIVHDFFSQPPTDPAYVAKIVKAQAAGEEWAKYYSAKPNPGAKAAPRWADRKIVQPAGTTAYIDLLTDSVAAVEKNYDPVLFYTQDRSGILRTPADVITFQPWHPGYVDYFVYRLGERRARARAQQFVVGRTQDAAAMCDPRLKQWIRSNGIELINFRDALYGTSEYQNHLRGIGSELAVTSA